MKAYGCGKLVSFPFGKRSLKKEFLFPFLWNHQLLIVSVKYYISGLWRVPIIRFINLSYVETFRPQLCAEIEHENCQRLRNNDRNDLFGESIVQDEITRITCF